MADLEGIFQSIEQGNALRDEKKYWEAAEAYTKARRELVELSQQGDVGGDAQIRELYQRQARDYLHRARETLLDALRREDDADRQVELTDPTHYERIAEKDDEACLERLRLFAWLFSNEKALAQHTKTAQEPPVQEQQLSLEDRFRALSASLPPSVKTNDERMKDINKGLKSLGITIPSNNTPKPQELFEANAKSDTEQVEDIIAQAKDEALLMGGQSTTSDSSVPSNGDEQVDDAGDAADKLMNSMIKAVEADKESKNADEADSDGEEQDDDGENEDEDDSPFLSSDLAYFQDRVNEAQASLAELNAMLDIDEEEDAGLLFDADTGKHALDSAIQYLQQMKKRWKEAKKRA